MEIEYGSFERQVQLVEPVEVDAAAAVYEAGMLTITLPLAVRETARERVTIVVRSRG
jgi:HSP20 family molecular chaperone IbpA